MTSKEDILLGLQPLFDEAEKTGKWFFVGSLLVDATWFSPADLRKKQAAGHFVWGAVNWHLRDPQEMIDELRRECLKAEDALARGKARVAASREK